MKLFILAASLRAGSLNRKLARAAATAAEKAGATIDLGDYREFETPMYDGDAEEKSGVPSGAQKLAERIAAADAVVISTPEYNGSIPGTLKNTIDWLSRLDPVPLEDKHVLLLSASPGGFGGVRSLWHTRVPFEVLGAFVYPTMFGVPRAHQAFDESGALLKDQKLGAQLEETMKSFLKHVEGRRS